MTSDNNFREKDGATIKVLTGTVDGVHGLIESETPTVYS